MRINYSAPMELNDGTPVRFIQFDRYDNTIQVSWVRPKGREQETQGWFYRDNGSRWNRTTSKFSFTLRNVAPKTRKPKTMTTKTKTTRGPIVGQPETIFAAVVDKTKTGNYGPFTVKNGQLLHGRAVVFSWFDNSSGIMPVSARSAFKTGEAHELFDDFLLALRIAGAKIEYVKSLGDFFNPDARFAEFMAGKPVAGITLSEAEAALPAALTALKARFVETFTAPKPPEPVYVRSKVAVTSANRLTVTGQRVSNGTYTISLTRAKRIFKDIVEPRWLKVPEPHTRRITATSAMADDRSRTVIVYGDRIAVGCQTIYRQALEELAVAQGWLVIPAAA